MDILYSSLSRSNVIHEDSGGLNDANDNKKSKLNNNNNNNNSGSISNNAKTSTPFNDDIKAKNTVAFNFVSPPPNCNSLIQNQSDTQIDQSTKNNSISNFDYLRQRHKRIIINDNQAIEAEIKIKESYLKHLRSIDLNKYSFPNENKPKTDYTYAQTGIYISHKKDTLDETPLEPPNLCRRARKVTPQNSILKESKFDLNESHYVGSFINKLNVFGHLYSFFKPNKKGINETISNQNETSFLTTNYQNDQITKTTTLLSNNSNNMNGSGKNFYLKNLYGLDDNMNTNSSSNNNNKNNNLVNSNSGNNSDKVNNNLSSNNRPKKSSICKWCLFLPLIALLIFFLIPYSQKDNLIEYVNLISNSKSYNQEYIKNAITNNINIFKNSIYETIDALKTKMPDEVKTELLKIIDDKFNATLRDLNLRIDDQLRDLNLRIDDQFRDINLRIADQELQLKESKSSFDDEFREFKGSIKELEIKYNIINVLIKETRDNMISLENVTDLIQIKVEDMIKKQIYIYNADKTGMTDYAAESLGANIMFTRCTETYTEKSRWLTVLNYPIFQINSSPRVIIQNSIHPGNCWAFKGHKGVVFIKLAATIKPKSFSLEHIPKELSPNLSLDTAPKNFSVYGYNNNEQIDSNDGILLGDFHYDNTSNEIVQFFDVQNENDKPISIIELKIESNGGNKEYTCVYKFRVHGEMITHINKNMD